MKRNEQSYAAIARRIKEQPLSESPLSHEWVELLTRLSRQDDPRLREIGISELSVIAEHASRSRHD